MLSEIPRSSRRCPAARSNASLRWPPASSRRSPPSCPSPLPGLATVPAPRRTPCDASLHRSAVASARSWSDPACPRLSQSPETVAAQRNPPLAKQSHAQNRFLQNIPPATTGNRSPVSARVAHCSRRKISRTASRRTHRTVPFPTVHSRAGRKDAPALSLAPGGRSTNAPAAVSAFVCPSPSMLLPEFDCILRETMTKASYFTLQNHISDFHHRLLVLLCHKRREQQNGQQASCLSRNLATRIRRVAMEYGLCRS